LRTRRKVCHHAPKNEKYWIWRQHRSEVIKW
jgi:hypothetical protein